MMMGLSDLGNSILAKPGGLQEGAVVRAELSTEQRLSGRLSGGRRMISPPCLGLVAPGWCPAGPPVLLATLAERASPTAERCPAKGLM